MVAQSSSDEFYPRRGYESSCKKKKNVTVTKILSIFTLEVCKAGYLVLLLGHFFPLDFGNKSPANQQLQSCIKVYRVTETLLLPLQVAVSVFRC